MGGKAHEVIASGHYDSDHFGVPNPKEYLTSHLYVCDRQCDLTKRWHSVTNTTVNRTEIHIQTQETPSLFTHKTAVL